MIFEMRLKLDMNKLYDQIEWDFLKGVLTKMGFDSSWIQMVMSCITTVDFFVIINGQTGNSFKPSRGLRQGDPISPYVFIIICDVLSAMINCAVGRGILQGIKFHNDGPTLSHLFFGRRFPSLP